MAAQSTGTEPTHLAQSGRSFLFLLASARADGNTELLARRAAEHLPSNVSQRWLHLDDLPLAPFRDVRHSDEPRREPAGNERLLLDATLAATDLVFASPLYWYSVSSSLKLYLDYWSAWLRVPDAQFKERMRGKTFWSVSALADDDPALAQPLVHSLELSAQYLDAKWGGALLGNGSWPGDILKDTQALDQARSFFDSVPAGLVGSAA